MAVRMEISPAANPEAGPSSSQWLKGINGVRHDYFNVLWLPWKNVAGQPGHTAVFLFALKPDKSRKSSLTLFVLDNTIICNWLAEWLQLRQPVVCSFTR